MSIKQKKKKDKNKNQGCKRCFRIHGYAHARISHYERNGIKICDGCKVIKQCSCIGGYIE